MAKRPTEVDSPEISRAYLIRLRDNALTVPNFEMAVALSHCIAWMYYLIELENEMKAQKEKK